MPEREGSGPGARAEGGRGLAVGRAAALAALSVTACSPAMPTPPPGVPLALARERAAALSDLRYDLRFEVPARVDEPIRGRARIAFERAPGAGPLVLDFAAPAASVLAVRAPGAGPLEHRVENESPQRPPGATTSGSSPPLNCWK